MFNFFKKIYIHLKYISILKKVYKQENLIQGISEMFGTEFKEDWVHRIYAVINPNIINNKYDNTSTIFEYGENGFDDKIFIERWIMERMNAISRFIRVNNLFDLLTYKINKLDNYNNYLFIIQPITLDDFFKSIKKLIIFIFITIILITLLFIFI